MIEGPDQRQPLADSRTVAKAGRTAGHAPFCFVVDYDSSTRHFLSLILHGSGIDAIEFPDGAAMRRSTLQPAPDIIFHNVSIDSSDAIESMMALGKRQYRGAVQLMSNRGGAVLEHVRSAGAQVNLNMLPVLKAPVGADAIVKITRDLDLAMPPPALGNFTLREALDKNWIAFWYQPKIDLRRKKLAGVEAFVRARHPQHGIAPPNSFMPGAVDGDILALSEMVVVDALRAGLEFTRLGVNLRIAVNVPIEALVKLPIARMVVEHRRPGERWPGLIIDVTEEQIVRDLPRAIALTAELERSNVRLAVDDFGRNYAALARIKDMPFAELKLDRAFVTDCGSDKVNAPLCKTVIDLAHNFGSTAVAVGIEKAADAVALVSMGCDLGQGFLMGQPMPFERFMSLLRQRAAAPVEQARVS